MPGFPHQSFLDNGGNRPKSEYYEKSYQVNTHCSDSSDDNLSRNGDDKPGTKGKILKDITKLSHLNLGRLSEYNSYSMLSNASSESLNECGTQSDNIGISKSQSINTTLDPKKSEFSDLRFCNDVPNSTHKSSLDLTSSKHNSVSSKLTDFESLKLHSTKVESEIHTKDAVKYNTKKESVLISDLIDFQTQSSQEELLSTSDYSSVIGDTSIVGFENPNYMGPESPLNFLPYRPPPTVNTPDTGISLSTSIELQSLSSPDGSESAFRVDSTSFGNLRRDKSEMWASTNVIEETEEDIYPREAVEAWLTPRNEKRTVQTMLLIGGKEPGKINAFKSPISLWKFTLPVDMLLNL